MPFKLLRGLDRRIALDPDAGAFAGRRLLQAPSTAPQVEPARRRRRNRDHRGHDHVVLLGRRGLDQLRDREPARFDVDQVGCDLAVGHRPGDGVVGRVEQIGVGDLLLALRKAGPGDGHQRRRGQELEDGAAFDHATISFWAAGCFERTEQLNQFLALGVEIAARTARAAAAVLQLDDLQDAGRLVGQHDRAVGELQRFVDIVGDEHHGLAGLEPDPLHFGRACAPRMLGSSAENGSSISTILGSTASARAMATRWRSPPESMDGYLPRVAGKPDQAQQLGRRAPAPLLVAARRTATASRAARCRARCAKERAAAIGTRRRFPPRPRAARGRRP